MAALSTKNLSTSDSSKQEKRTKVLAYEKFHHELFVKERKLNPKFYPRVPYMYKGQLVIGLYKREIGTVDIYLEFCDSALDPLDEQRTLWKWIYNPNFKTDYPQGAPNHVTGDQVYLIPVSELIDVSRYHDLDRPIAILPTNVKDISPKEEPKPEPVKEEPKTVPVEDKFFDENSVAGADLPLEAVTLRDLAAIIWQKPVSSKPWFNELIKQTFKQ